MDRTVDADEFYAIDALIQNAGEADSRNPETGKPFVTIKHSWQKARKDADLQGLRVHDLRHTAASQFANSGVSLFTIATLLGHSDLKSSSRYSHLADTTLMAAAEAGASKMSSRWAV